MSLATKKVSRPTISRELRLVHKILESIKRGAKTVWQIYQTMCDVYYSPGATHMTVYNKVRELADLGLVQTETHQISPKKKIIFVKLTEKGQRFLENLDYILSM